MVFKRAVTLEKFHATINRTTMQNRHYIVTFCRRARSTRRARCAVTRPEISVPQSKISNPQKSLDHPRFLKSEVTHPPKVFTNNYVL